jgi:hypothetical protein
MEYTLTSNTQTGAIAEQAAALCSSKGALIEDAVKNKKSRSIYFADIIPFK